MKKIIIIVLTLLIVLHNSNDCYSQTTNSFECNTPFDPGQTPPDIPLTLCQKYGSDQSYVVWDNSSSPNGILLSSSFGLNKTGIKINLKSNLYIDNLFSFLRCTIKIDPGVKIFIMSDKKLTIDKSFLFSCNQLWGGIDLDIYSKIVLNQSEIEDASVAIFSDKNYSSLFLTGNVFNRNLIGIKLVSNIVLSPPIPDPNPPIFPIPLQRIQIFNENSFTANSTLNDGSIISQFGIFLTNISLIVNSKSKNYFVDQSTGIKMTGFNSLAITNFDFSNCYFNSILVEDGIQEIKKCYFRNGAIEDVKIGKSIKCNIENCIFSNTYTGRNKMTNTSIKILSTNVKAKFTIINNQFNLFEEAPTQMRFKGIEFKGNDIGNNTLININNNTFTIKGQSALGMVFDGIFPISTYANIKLNHFFIAITNANRALGNSGISLINGDKNNFKIESNDFNNLWLYGNISSSLECILLSGCMNGKNNVILSNTFNTQTATRFSTWGNSAISVDGFNTALIKDNRINNCCIYSFKANLFNDLNIQCNKFYGNVIFQLDNTLIHTQDYHDNQWLGWPINTHLLHASSEAEFINSNPTSLILSSFKMHEPQSTFDPSTSTYNQFFPSHPVRVTPDTNDEWFKYFADNTSICLQGLYSEDINIEELEFIITNNLDSIFNSNIASRFIKRALYNKLTPYINNNYSLGPNLINFYDNYSNSEAGNLQIFLQNLSERYILSEQNNQIIENLMDTMVLYNNMLIDITSVMPNSEDSLTLNQFNSFNTLYDSLYNKLNNVKLKLDEIKFATLGIQNTILDDLTATNSNDSFIVREIHALKSLIKVNNNLSLTSNEINEIILNANKCPEQIGYSIYLNRSFINCDDLKNWDNLCNIPNINNPNKKNDNITNGVQKINSVDFLNKNDEYFLVYNINGIFQTKIVERKLFHDLQLPSGVYIIIHTNNLDNTRITEKWVKY